MNIHQCVRNKGLTKKSSTENGNNWLHVLEHNSFTIKNCSNVEIEKKFPTNNLTQNEKISKIYGRKIPYSRKCEKAR